MDKFDRNTRIIAVMIIVGVILAGSWGYYFGTVTASQGSQSSGVATNTSTLKQTQASKNTTVNLDIIADWGGAGYDAFVPAANIGSSPPTPATNTSAPGPSDNNVSVAANTTVKFIITTTDTAVLENYTAQVTTPFTVFNDTDSGQVSLQYQAGQNVSNLPIGHTFTISQLGLNIPIPPTTVVEFSLNFAHAGSYLYFCETPCGPGMNYTGYMMGYVNVK